MTQLLSFLPLSVFTVFLQNEIHALFVGFFLEANSSSEESSGNSDGDVYKIYLHAIKFLSPDDVPASRHLDDKGLPLNGLPQGHSGR